jgi:hypothetical protein
MGHPGAQDPVPVWALAIAMEDKDSLRINAFEAIAALMLATMVWLTCSIVAVFSQTVQ